MKVTAKDETIAKNIKHPSGKGFMDDGTSDWPDDQFTKRRIRDGDITVTEPPPEGRAKKEQPPKP